MRLFKKKIMKERRLPANAELRKHFDAEQKLQTQESLASAQTLTEQNARRIGALRAIARVAKRL